jgi:DNA-binding NarL/FixJ family response regulator
MSNTEATPNLRNGFTAREKLVFDLVISKGTPPKETAEQIQITDRTVRFHLNNIYRKLGVNNKAEATGRVIFSKFINEQRASNRTRAAISNSLEKNKDYVAEIPVRLQELTPRQMEVLGLITLGSNNAEIAEQLLMTEETVKFHLTGIYRKLDVKNRIQAINVARESGVLQLILKADTINGITEFLESKTGVGNKRMSIEEAKAKVSELTNAESVVLSFLSLGLTNSEIAEKLGVSQETIKFHVSNILGKLDAKTRREAASLEQLAFMGVDGVLVEEKSEIDQRAA